jgi:hypothetical protein
MSDLYVLPRLAVERLVLDALSAAGLRDDLAVGAAAHLVRSSSVTEALDAWTTWSTENCMGCRLHPLTCPILNGVNQEGVDVRHAVGKSIEQSFFPCPARVTDETPPG